MLRVQLYLILICLASVFSRYSPQKWGENIYYDRNADEVSEDARLDVPRLIEKYGYPVEEHTVTTTDGYILKMHRIPHGIRDTKKISEGPKPVVFLMHGLLSSSADWIIMGPGSGFGYILADEGFDVWLGNARGNSYSRKHIYLNPNITNARFWKFSWDEIGNVDVPSMIDYILETTGQEKLHYVGHSQGTTAFFVMGSLRPEYNKKIISMHALAPVAYMAHTRNPFLLAIAPHEKFLEGLLSRLGTGEFMPHRKFYQKAEESICRRETSSSSTSFCNNMYFMITRWDISQLNGTMIPAILGHAPAGASVKQFAHYAQSINYKQFRRYNHGSKLANLIAYQTLIPPRYDLSEVSAPVYLYYCDNDLFTQSPDIERLYGELGRPMGKFRVPLATFGHVDFLWGIYVKELVYDRVINLMKFGSPERHYYEDSIENYL